MFKKYYFFAVILCCIHVMNASDKKLQSIESAKNQIKNYVQGILSDMKRYEEKLIKIGEKISKIKVPPSFKQSKECYEALQRIPQYEQNRKDVLKMIKSSEKNIMESYKKFIARLKTMPKKTPSDIRKQIKEIQDEGKSISNRYRKVLTKHTNSVFDSIDAILDSIVVICLTVKPRQPIFGGQ